MVGMKGKCWEYFPESVVVVRRDAGIYQLNPGTILEY